MAKQESSPFLTNQSTEKALAILELLAAAKEPMRLSSISEQLGLNASTSVRFLNALIRCGYAEKNNDQRYRLTYKICRLSNQVREHTSLQSVTHPWLLELSNRYHEALCVSIEQDMQMVYTDVVAGSHQTLMSLQQIGNVSPMHCTGNGKLALLNYSDEQLDELIARRGLHRYTENTLTTKEALCRELSQIRAEDVAYDREECELGIRCIACPIRDDTGAVVAGISITGPAVRMRDETLATLRKPLHDAAVQISRSIGWES